MKQSEALKLVAILKAAYPRQETDEATAEAYVGFLTDLDVDLVDRVVRDLIATSRFFPTIAEIRGAAAEASCGLPSVTAALAMVTERHRLTDDELAARPLPVAVKQAYRLVGGAWAFRTSEHPTTLHAQFRDAYRAIRDEAVRTAQTPAALRPPAVAAIEAASAELLPRLRVVPT